MTRQNSISDLAVLRKRMLITGAVQGVGFRPCVYRLALELGLTGFVGNDSQGVIIEVEGSERLLEEFQRRLTTELPPRAFISSIESSTISVTSSPSFLITESDAHGQKSAIVLPDIATCPDCLAEVFDPGNRRYLYPFTNCTNCGPRYSIIKALPYDRCNTTMAEFTMCPECEREYRDPLNRRFHAQPNACPTCGPHVEFRHADGKVGYVRDEAIDVAVRLLSEGKIVAVKGLGGFQLLVDAANDSVVRELRIRKRRSNKPFAVMYPDGQSVDRDCDCSELERNLVASPESPIVLVKLRKNVAQLSGLIAPGNPYLGVMIPYTPLHHILMHRFGQPVVATSGNLSEEPICIDEQEALKRLEGIADGYLVHDRPIQRHVDDSVVRVMGGRMQVVRRARGYAPLPISVNGFEADALAVGGHLKNTVAIRKGGNIFVGQHIGDLESVESNTAFRASVDDLSKLYELEPTCVAHDCHPDYGSTIYAESTLPSKLAVQHHYAHVLSCLADNNVMPPALGVSWDGTGYGDDGSIWGGEFLALDGHSYHRVAHLKTFRLPGGDSAVREPRRSAVGMLFELQDASFDSRHGFPFDETFSSAQLETIESMLRQNLNSPLTSSCGRLFDAVAAIIGLNQVSTFEGEAAMMLEFAIDCQSDETYRFEVAKSGDKFELDWRPMIRQIIADSDSRVPVSTISARFHNTLVEMIVAVARRIRLRRVVLSGGCFMNKYLTERTILRLRAGGFVPYWHNQIPTNDGGISVGQIMAISRARSD